MSIVKANNIRCSNKLAYVASASDHFTDIQLIAKGGFGVIYGGVHKLDGNRYAIKHMRSKATSSLFQMQVAEIRMLSRIYHPNIVRYHNSWVDERHGTMNLFMQMEFITQTLESYLVERYDRNRDGHIDEHIDGQIDGHALDIAFGLVEAVHFLHVHMKPALIHGDITPSNVMLQYAQERCIAKLCDFGLASVASSAVEFSGASSQHGTITYQAPEYHATKTPSVDVYSVGIVLFQLFCTFSSAMERYARIRAFKALQSTTSTLLDQTILEDHTQRPTIGELRQYMTQHAVRMHDTTQQSQSYWAIDYATSMAS